MTCIFRYKSDHAADFVFMGVSLCSAHCEKLWAVEEVYPSGAPRRVKEMINEVRGDER